MESIRLYAILLICTIMISMQESALSACYLSVPGGDDILRNLFEPGSKEHLLALFRDVNGIEKIEAMLAQGKDIEVHVLQILTIAFRMQSRNIKIHEFIKVIQANNPATRSGIMRVSTDIIAETPDDRRKFIVKVRASKQGVNKILSEFFGIHSDWEKYRNVARHDTAYREGSRLCSIEKRDSGIKVCYQRCCGTLSNSENNGNQKNQGSCCEHISG